MTEAEAQSLTGAIAAWVRESPDLKALALAGSWARGAARPDSDLDLLILADDPQRYRSDTRWLQQIALPKPFRVLSGREATYGVVWSCHVLLDPPEALELSFGPLEWACPDPIDAGSRRVVRDGFRVIVDKDGCLQRLVEAAGKADTAI